MHIYFYFSTVNIQKNKIKLIKKNVPSPNSLFLIIINIKKLNIGYIVIKLINNLEKYNVILD